MSSLLRCRPRRPLGQPFSVTCRHRGSSPPFGSRPSAEGQLPDPASHLLSPWSPALQLPTSQLCPRLPTLQLYLKSVSSWSHSQSTPGSWDQGPETQLIVQGARVASKNRQHSLRIRTTEGSWSPSCLPTSKEASHGPTFGYEHEAPCTSLWALVQAARLPPQLPALSDRARA